MIWKVLHQSHKSKGTRCVSLFCRQSFQLQAQDFSSLSSSKLQGYNPNNLNNTVCESNGSLSAKKTHPRATKWNVSRTPPSCIVFCVCGLAMLKRVFAKSLQRFWMNKPSPCHVPQRMKFQVMPCQRPMSNIVVS